VPGNPLLGEAIAECSDGVDSAPRSLNSLTLLTALKTVRGDVTHRDWDRLRERISSADPTLDNARVYLILIYHARKGVQLNRRELLKTLDVLTQRFSLGSYGLASIGYFIMNDLADHESAIPYFVQAIKAANPNDPFARQLEAELRADGRPDLAEKIEKLGEKRRREADTVSGKE
jgi:hypothetical protein